MMARQCAMTTDKEHLHWQETFRVFTTPDRLPGTTTKVFIFHINHQLILIKDFKQLNVTIQNKQFILTIDKRKRRDRNSIA